MAKSFDALAGKTMSKDARRKAQERAREIMAEMLLAELRQAVGPSQRELARRLGVSQPTLSRMERQDDMQITTLQRLVNALGGELEIVARFPKGKVAIRQFGSDKPGRRGTRRELELV